MHEYVLKMTSILGNLKRHTFSFPNTHVKEAEANILTSEIILKIIFLIKLQVALFNLQYKAKVAVSLISDIQWRMCKNEETYRPCNFTISGPESASVSFHIYEMTC